MILPRPAYSVPLPNRAPLRLAERTLVMGILNITPDSFADGGLHFDSGRAIEYGLELVEAGADILDVGGESTRPGAAAVEPDEELRRVLPVIEQLASRTRVPISVDTYKAIVAREAVACGAVIVNDVSGLLFDGDLADAVAGSGAALILMHNRGKSSEMYREAVYGDVVAEIGRELQAAISRAEAAGVARDRIVVDPGLGFAKRAEHTYQALAGIERLGALGRPILAGPSRKSFLRLGAGELPPAERDWGTAAAVTASILMGAHIVRVHNVRRMAEVAGVADRIRAAALAAEAPPP